MYAQQPEPLAGLSRLVQQRACHGDQFSRAIHPLGQASLTSDCAEVAIAQLKDHRARPNPFLSQPSRHLLRHPAQNLTQLRTVGQVAGEGGLGAHGLALLFGLHRPVVEAVSHTAEPLAANAEPLDKRGLTGPRQLADSVHPHLEKRFLRLGTDTP